MMALNPGALEKAQAQINAVVGKDRLPTMDDRPLLPFVDAIFRETLRYSPIAPLCELSRPLDNSHYRATQRFPLLPWTMTCMVDFTFQRVNNRKPRQSARVIECLLIHACRCSPHNEPLVRAFTFTFLRDVSQTALLGRWHTMNQGSLTRTRSYPSDSSTTTVPSNPTTPNTSRMDSVDGCAPGDTLLTWPCGL